MHYTVIALKTPYEQKVLLDGPSTKLAAEAKAALYNLLTGERVVVTRGKRCLGKFVSEFGSEKQ